MISTFPEKNPSLKLRMQNLREVKSFDPPGHGHWLLEYFPQKG